MKGTSELKAVFERHPELPQDVASQLTSLYDRKLWHELSLELRKVFASPAFQHDGVLREIFVHFIADFGLQINLLHFAKFAADVAKQMDGEQAIPFLQQHLKQLKEVNDHTIEEPVLYLSMAVAEHHIYVGSLGECKSLMDEGVSKLDAMPEVRFHESFQPNAVVSAAVYSVKALYAKARQDFAAYYRAALHYLSFASLEDMPTAEQVALARDVALAALLGDSVYSFAELLLHPVVKALDGTPHAWLPELLHCFSDGDMFRYEELCVKYGPQMNEQPALVAAERALKEKITIMLPPDERCIPVTTIAARTRLDADGAEFLLMKAMSLRLIEGTIDEIAGTVNITWVQPRVLMLPEVAALKGHLQAWMQKVDAATELLESEGVSTVEALA